MSINKPAIAAGSTQWIARAYGARVPIVSSLPGTPYRGINEDGIVDEIVDNPSVHGELIIYQTGEGDYRVMSLYVGVDVNDTIVWKKAAILEGSDRYTNQQPSVIL